MSSPRRKGGCAWRSERSGCRGRDHNAATPHLDKLAVQAFAPAGWMSSPIKLRSIVRPSPVPAARCLLICRQNGECHGRDRRPCQIPRLSCGPAVQQKGASSATIPERQDQASETPPATCYRQRANRKRLSKSAQSFMEHEQARNANAGKDVGKSEMIRRKSRRLDFSLFSDWCPRRDSNSHASRRRILNPLRLPFHHSGQSSADVSGRARADKKQSCRSLPKRHSDHDTHRSRC